MTEPAVVRRFYHLIAAQLRHHLMPRTFARVLCVKVMSMLSMAANGELINKKDHFLLILGGHRARVTLVANFAFLWGKQTLLALLMHNSQ